MAIKFIIAICDYGISSFFSFAHLYILAQELGGDIFDVIRAKSVFTRRKYFDIKDEEQLFQSFLKEVLHADKAYNSQFDFIKIYRLIMENSNDYKQVAGSLLDTKIAVLNSSLFMGIVNWFDAGRPVEGLYEHLINTVKVCLYGLLGDVKEG